MKGVQVYHSVKYLHSLGYSIRNIAKITKLSSGTVQKYLNTSREKALQTLVKVHRKSEFDQAKGLIDEQLTLFPEITSAKLFRIIKDAHPAIKSRERGFRKYIAKIRGDYGKPTIRFYQPIITDKPGFQVQVDPGEDWVLLDNHEKMKVYFVAFIFGFSRQRYFYLQTRPFNTGDFIRAHKEAFAFFGGIAEEYVYDQTKLVVISERYREVWLNNEFNRFALESGFLPVVCEGYDPESKGKVERLVQYIKNDFLYGETFADLNDVQEKSLIWLKRVNSLVHSTTNQVPAILFSEEQKVLKHYTVQNLPEKRKVDKTGLLSYKSNKYSVPYQYQQKVVLISVLSDDLLIMDIKTNAEICRHKISIIKGAQILNTNHYRSYEDTLSEIKSKCLIELKHIHNSELLIEKIMADNPKIQRDQLRGLLSIYKKNEEQNWSEIIALSLQLQIVRASVIEKIIINSKEKKEMEEISKKYKKNDITPAVSKLDRSLKQYDEVCR